MAIRPLLAFNAVFFFTNFQEISKRPCIIDILQMKAT